MDSSEVHPGHAHYTILIFSLWHPKFSVPLVASSGVDLEGLGASAWAAAGFRKKKIWLTQRQERGPMRLAQHTLAWRWQFSVGRNTMINIYWDWIQADLLWPEAVGFEFVWGSYCFTGTRSSFNFCFLHPNCMQVRFILMVIKGEMVSIPNEKQSVALGAFDKSHGNLWMVVLIGLNQTSRSLHGILPFPAMRLWQNESVTS